jgi:hypothetical protein
MQSHGPEQQPEISEQLIENSNISKGPEPAKILSALFRIGSLNK